MDSIRRTTHGCLRVGAGIILIIAGLDPADEGWLNVAAVATLGDPPSLATAVFSKAIRVLMLLAGTWILLGVRTRLIAAYVLSMILLDSAISLYHTGELTGPILLVSALILSLSILVMKGGGESAIYRRGWEDLPF